MSTGQRAALKKIRTFPMLVRYLREEMGWPIESEDFDEITFEYTPEELGIDAKNAAKIEEIRRLRPLSLRQPWGIFFVKFEPKRLPVVALRRILSQVVVKKRASSNRADRVAWAANDLLFVSNYGEGKERCISFAHFSQDEKKKDLPTLKVLGWDNSDTALHLDEVAGKLTHNLAWPEEDDIDGWRKSWRSAFTLRHREAITTSRDLSIRLAELARTIRDRIRLALAIETETGPLSKLLNAFQEALVHDLDADGFADMYAQTIAYGLLSARVANPKGSTADDLPAQLPVTNPFLKELMETFLHVGGRRGKAGGPGIDFDELGVSEVVELLDAANMEAVIRDFGDRNPLEDPVIHFYEHFLAAYDKKQKVQRGVFYTPRPIVSYIVRSVDELLRTEFGLEDGLADTTTWGDMVERQRNLRIPEGVSSDHAFVQILDPATGTGTFLVEVIDTIYRTMKEKWEKEAGGSLLADVQGRWNEYVPDHLLPRLHGYELLMAPYAIAHLKIGLKLFETGYRFGAEKRARVYLTNALEPASNVGQQVLEGILPALAHEADAVNAIKQKQRFTIVIGNPPYSVSTQNQGVWAKSIIRRYKEGLNEKKHTLDDDYVKFVALSQWQLDRSSVGVFGFITNHGYMKNPTFRGMRESLLKSFSKLMVLDLHGNLRQKEATGVTLNDENIFDIQQGVVVTLACRSNRVSESKQAFFSELWGTRLGKHKKLLGSSFSGLDWHRLRLSEPFFLFVPQDEVARAEYSKWSSLAVAFSCYGSGVKTDRDKLCLDTDRRELSGRMRTLFSGNYDDDFIERFGVRPSSSYNIVELARRTKFSDGDLTPCLYRPFDVRWLYYKRGFTSRPAWRVMQHMHRRNNVALLSARTNKSGRMDHFFCTRLPTEVKVAESTTQSCVFPLYFIRDSEGLKIGKQRTLNLTPAFLKMISSALGLQGDVGTPQGELTGDDVFHYAYATFFSPTYRRRYAEFLRIDYPRIPQPCSLNLFRDLSRLGGDLVALHLLDSSKLANLITTYTGPKNPVVGRVGWSAATAWLDAGKTNAREGHRATKPGTVGFHGVPEEVWDFHIGGYQVCHKWLKDRKGRTLSADDLAHYQKIVVALNETIRIMKEIDELIEVHGGWPGAFQTGVKRVAEVKEPLQVGLFKPRVVEPRAQDRYETCVPLVPLKIAAGTFGDPQHGDDEGFEWVEIRSGHRLRPGMFVAQVVGKSMDPLIPDGSYCLFRSPVEGSRHGPVLVELRDTTDPETGERYTVKRYESEKAARGADSWRHTRITLKPVNPDFEPIVLTGAVDEQLRVVAELVEVLRGEGEA